MRTGTVIAAAMAVTLTGCGMTAGLRPVVEESVRAAPTTPATTPTEASVQGVTVTTRPVDPTTTLVTIATIATIGTSPDTTATPASTTASTAETTSPTTVDTTTPSVPSATTAELATTTTTEFADIGTVFSEPDAFVDFDCEGGDVTIASDGGTYTLGGSCRGVLVKGSFNTVFAESIDQVDLTGTLNVIVSGGNPVVNDWDGENIISVG